MQNAERRMQKGKLSNRAASANFEFYILHSAFCIYSSPMPARPFVTANFALTWDARISTRRRTPSDFSSPRDKRRLLEIRATCDAILVSAATLAADQMSMGLPAPDLRAARRARRQPEYPLRVVVSRSGRIDPALRLFAQSFSPIVIFSTTRMPVRTRTALAQKADLWLYDADSVDFADLLHTLRREYRVKRLVCEGGSQIFRALLKAGLIDEIHVTLCPRIFGGAEAPTLTGPAGDFLPRGLPLKLREMEVRDGECFLRYSRVTGAGAGVMARSPKS
jgi:riboflavin-specific deaminase-like protein